MMLPNKHPRRRTDFNRVQRRLKGRCLPWMFPTPLSTLPPSNCSYKDKLFQASSLWSKDVQQPLFDHILEDKSEDDEDSHKDGAPTFRLSKEDKIWFGLPSYIPLLLNHMENRSITICWPLKFLTYGIYRKTLSDWSWTRLLYCKVWAGRRFYVHYFGRPMFY